MDKKKILKLLWQVLKYIATLIAGYAGGNAVL